MHENDNTNNKRYALLGLDARSAQALQLALKYRARGSYTLCDASDAHVVIADFDTQAALAEYQALRTHQPDIPVIAIGAHRPEFPGLAAYLPKPVQLNALIELVEPLVQAAMEAPRDQGVSPAKIAQAMKAIDAQRAAASLDGRVLNAGHQPPDLKRGLSMTTQEESFQPDRFLLGHVQKAFDGARETGKAIVLTYLSSHTIAFDPASDTVVTSLSDRQLRSVAMSPCYTLPLEVRPLPNGIADLAESGKYRVSSAEAFLWNLGYLTSRGRLPHTTQAAEQMYLRRWPNLTRTVLPRNAMRVIAYWVRQPCQLRHLHERLGVAIEDVFAVYSAAQAAGLAGSAQRQADGILDAFDVADDGRRGLFSAILKRLGAKRAEPVRRAV